MVPSRKALSLQVQAASNYTRPQTTAGKCAVKVRVVLPPPLLDLASKGISCRLKVQPCPVDRIQFQCMYDTITRLRPGHCLCMHAQI